MVRAAHFENLLDDRAVLALQFTRATVGRDIVRALIDLDEEVAVGAGLGCADQRAVLGVDADRLAPTRELDAVGDGRDHADLGEVLLVARHEHDAFILANRGSERDAHTWEDDHVIKRDQA